VHKQNLVDRDIKPGNIMARLKDEGSIRAKIIDPGLAKAVTEASFQTEISTPGGFVGTPEFASPAPHGGVRFNNGVAAEYDPSFGPNGISL
jgi:serine/threonine protein kinase